MITKPKLTPAELLDEMAHQVDAAIYDGDFWLSVNMPSKNWIYLVDLDNDYFRGQFKEVYTEFLNNFLSEQDDQWCVVFCDRDRAHATELNLRRAIVDATEALKANSSFGNRVENVFAGIDEHKVDLPPEIDYTNKHCIIIVALSLHIDLIDRLREALETRGATVTHILTVVEREARGREIFETERKLTLIPMLVWQQGSESLTVTSVLRNPAYTQYHHYFQPGYIDLDELLRKFPPRETSKLRNKLWELQDKIKNDPLYQKAEKIVRGIDALYERHGQIELVDTETIQKWVVERLAPDEFKTMAKISFAAWATPERLKGEGVPHINLANDKMGDRAVEIAKEQGIKAVRLLDLGAGTLGTVNRVATKLSAEGYPISINAVEFTPELLTIAQERKTEIEAKLEGCIITIYPEEMLSFTSREPDNSYHFITISYAIHHLHPDEQIALMRQMYRCLRPGGACLIADPQEGKSKFNRETLLREEPEAVFAKFSSPEECLANLKTVSFEADDKNNGILLKDDEYLGFLVCARKPH